MYDQEKEHHDKMRELVTTHRARPSLMTPVWSLAGFALGAATGLMGREAAMACTVAVETEISQHYNDQLRELIEKAPEEVELRDVLTRFRDDEIEVHVCMRRV